MKNTIDLNKYCNSTITVKFTGVSKAKIRVNLCKFFVWCAIKTGIPKEVIIE